MRLKLTLEYDGTRFQGFASQPGLRTVHGSLEQALGSLYRLTSASPSPVVPTRAYTHSPTSCRWRSRAVRRSPAQRGR